MKHACRLNTKGMTTIIVLAIILGVFLTMTIFLMGTSRTLLHVAVQEGHIKNAQGLASNAVVDVMRQLSQGYYQDHYDPNFLNKTEAFYNNGFSDCTIEPNEQKQYLFITATSKAGRSALNPRAAKRLFCAIRFRSPWTEFASFVPPEHTQTAEPPEEIQPTWSGVGVTMNGPYINFKNHHDLWSHDLTFTVR